jgi:hypothetical protein
MKVTYDPQVDVLLESFSAAQQSRKAMRINRV